MAHPRPLNHAASASLSRSVPPSEALQSVSFLSHRLHTTRQWLQASTACSPRAFIVEMKEYFHSTQHSRSTRVIAKRESAEMLMIYDECQALRLVVFLPLVSEFLADNEDCVCEIYTAAKQELTSVSVIRQSAAFRTPVCLRKTCSSFIQLYVSFIFFHVSVFTRVNACACQCVLVCA